MRVKDGDDGGDDDEVDNQAWYRAGAVPLVLLDTVPSWRPSGLCLEESLLHAAEGCPRWVA
jgi:hypothetical protein